MDNWISKYIHYENLYDISEMQAEIWYITASILKNTFKPPFHICLKIVPNII